MSIDDLYLNTTVPLPSRALEIAETDSQPVVCQKLDRFFDDIIRKYSSKTQEILKGMYYKGDETDVLKAECTMSQVRLDSSSWIRMIDESTPVCEVGIDPCFWDSPMLLRFFKIREIAGATGQRFARINDIGFADFYTEMTNGTFLTFTEASIAPAEKMMINALPEKLMDREVELIGDEEKRELVRWDFKQRKAMDYNDYIQLQHRMKALPPVDHNRLHGRDDVRAFGEWMIHTRETLPSDAPVQRARQAVNKRNFS